MSLQVSSNYELQGNKVPELTAAKFEITNSKQRGIVVKITPGSVTGTLPVPPPHFLTLSYTKRSNTKNLSSTPLEEYGNLLNFAVSQHKHLFFYQLFSLTDPGNCHDH